MVTEEFKKIAVSFAGGDGGNPKSEVWFCGLEWGIGVSAQIYLHKPVFLFA